MLESPRRIVWVAAAALLTTMSAAISPGATSASAASAAPLVAVRATSRAVPRRVSPAEEENEKNGHYCDGCTPPLLYSGGPTMDTTGPTGVTITPIYWQPDGSTPFPDTYPAIINQYITDIAADSGTSNNVYSVNEEYYQELGGATTNIVYQITAGEPIVDTEPFPADGCDLLEGYTNCISDAQLRDELARVIAENGLTADLANFYPMFFPPEVMTEDLDGSNSDSAYCGYHRAFDSEVGFIVYGNEPYASFGCDAGQGPNGDVIADGAVGTLSHEINEAITDPADEIAWNDSSGNEIGDICANDYGQALGSTDPDNPDETLYNQQINGNFYYTQTEFSNAAFATLGEGNGCVQHAEQSDTPVEQEPTDVAQVFTFAYPNGLDADGASTADISTSVSDYDFNIIEGDTVNFTVYAVAGDGQCGTLSVDSVKTGPDGYANTVYTASTDDIICAVVATDAQGGQASTGTVYQGAAQELAPTATDTFPTDLVPGGDPVYFTTEFSNPGDEPIVNAQVDFSIFPADGATDDVTADQVQLAYSLDGEDGEFAAVQLYGSTVGEGGIEGTLGEAGDTMLQPGETLTVTYELLLGDTVISSGDGPLMSFEAYLNQVNPASGAGTNLADTAATDVFVGAATIVDETIVDETIVDETIVDETSVDETGVDETSVDETVVDEASSEATIGTDTSSSSDDSDSSTGLVIGVIAAVLVVAVGAFLVIRRRRR